MFSWFGSKSEGDEVKNEAAEPDKDKDTKKDADDHSKENKTDEQPVTTTARNDGPKSQSSGYGGLTGAMGQFLTVDCKSIQ